MTAEEELEAEAYNVTWMEMLLPEKWKSPNWQGRRCSVFPPQPQHSKCIFACIWKSAGVKWTPLGDHLNQAWWVALPAACSAGRKRKRESKAEKGWLASFFCPCSVRCWQTSTNRLHPLQPRRAKLALETLKLVSFIALCLMLRHRLKTKNLSSAELTN